MKKLIFRSIAFMIFTSLLILSGCKSHKKTIVNAVVEIEPETVWQLVSISGKSVPYKDGQRKVSLQFNPESETMKGMSGCNRYFGSYKLAKNGAVSFSDINGTKMACPDDFMNLEHSYLQLLKKVDRIEMTAYSLDLYQGNKLVLSFSKSED